MKSIRTILLGISLILGGILFGIADAYQQIELYVKTGKSGHKDNHYVH